MMLLAMSGIDSTVAVTSRSAYSCLSAGASSSPALAMTAPTSRSCRRNCSRGRSPRQPGMLSSLSSVPPVWPSPRPDSFGTATPSAATSGATTSETLSPTPPEECLSTTGRPVPDRSSRSPLATIADVQADSSRGVIPRHTTAMSSALICSCATSPRTYASSTHATCSSDSSPPSRLVRMTSTALVTAGAPSAGPGVRRRPAAPRSSAARPAGCRRAGRRRRAPTAAAGSARTA